VLNGTFQHGRLHLIAELTEKRLRVFQVAGVEAFGEPSGEWDEEVARGGALALVAPEAREAGRCASFSTDAAFDPGANGQATSDP
jgi:hypothetical protein